MTATAPTTSRVEFVNSLPASERSPAEILAALPEDEREAMLAELDVPTKSALRWYWPFWARPKQLAPNGDWRTWVLRAGRGFGKTRAGGGWVHSRAMEEPRWVALVAKNPADARDYMIEGPGGIMKNTPRVERPKYEPSKRRLTWPNESWATIYSSEEPDQLRGYSGDTAWLDEFAKWNAPRESWDNLEFGMREASSDRPRIIITTTPRPVKILTEIQDRDSTVVVVGSSYENRSNLDPTWYEEVIIPREGTRLGRQEIWAEILDDLPGALWPRALIEASRLEGKRPEMVRIVVAVDPAVTSGEDADLTGIIVAGRGTDGLGYVLDDITCRKSPDAWAKDVVNAYHKWEADRVVAEVNQGGDMVETLLRTVDDGVSYRPVRATRGKRLRAEPVAALYEQGKVKHVRPFPELEDQMAQFVPDVYEESPDRVDALVYALTELILEARTYSFAVVGGE